MSINRTLVRTVLLASGLLACAQGRFSVTCAANTNTSVPGTGNPWLAGMPAGTNLEGDVAGPAGDSQSPAEVTGVTLTAGSELTLSATGSVNFVPGPSNDPPDGNVGYPISHAAANGISGVTAPANALVGVFLGPDQPDGSAAPAPLDFSTGASRDYSTLGPALRQVFFIGDGSTTDGAPQHVTVPAGATRLFLGGMDGSGWYNNSGSFTVQVSGGGTSVPPQLSISKALASSVTLAKPGDTISYVLTYSSAGPGSPVTDPQVVDALPSGTGFVSAFFLDANGQETSSPVAGPNGRNPEFSGGNVIWYLGKNGQKVLDPGDAGKLKLTVKVNDTINPGQAKVSNSDYRVRGTAGAGTVQAIGGTSIDVPLASLQIDAKTAPTSAVPGENLVYTLTVTNKTPSTVSKAVVSDVLPAGVSFVSASAPGKLTQPGNLLQWSVGSIQPNQQKAVTFTVQVPYDPDPDSRIVVNSQYSVAGLGPAGRITAEGTPLTTPIVGNAPHPPVLGLDIRTSIKSDDPEDNEITVLPNEVITYFIDYVNAGTAPVRGAVLADAVPAGLTPSHVSNKGVYDSARHQLRWALGDLNGGGPSARGSSGTVSFQVKVPATAAPGTLIQNGFFSLTASNLNTVTNGTPAPLTVKVVPPLTFYVEAAPNVSYLSADSTVKKIVYSLNYVNLGGTKVSNVVLSSLIPANSTLLDDTLGGPARTVSDGMIHWAFRSVSPRVWGQVRFAVTTTATTGSILEQANIQGGGASAQSSLVETPILSGARLFVSISAPLSTTAGDLTYRITYGNMGDEEASDVRITDTLPAGTTFANADNGGTPSGNQVVWSDLQLPGHSGGAVLLSVHADGAGSIVNRDCHIEASNGLPNFARYVAHAEPVNATDKYAGAVTTRVRSSNAFFAVMESIGGFFQSIGGSIANFVGSIFTNTKLRQDVQAVNEQSRGTSQGGADLIGLKNGVTILPLGSGQVMVIGPPSLISNDGGSLISNDGGSITVVGNASSITLLNIGSGFTSMSASALLADAAHIVAVGAGNLVSAGGGNLISNDGGSLISNDGGSLVAIAARIASMVNAGNGNTLLAGGGSIASAGVISNDGHSLISNDGGSLISNDGGSLSQINGGNLLTSRAGNTAP